MEEFKIFFGHKEALEILQKFEAVFIKAEVLEDIYLIDDGRDIWKLARVDKKIYLVHLENRNNGFEIKLKKEIEEGKVFEEIKRFFNVSEEIMRKERRCYMLGESEIALDSIKNLGQFVELYPASDREKEKLFKLFHVKSTETITKSYHSL